MIPQITRRDPAEIGVGDIIRVNGEDFDSAVMRVMGDRLQLAGWPNPWVETKNVAFREKYDPATACEMQHACFKQEQERLAQIDLERKSRCQHCGGTGRAPRLGTDTVE